MAFGKRKYWMDQELLSIQVAELVKSKKLAKFLICENINEKNTWESGLMDLLFEYYTHVKQMLKYLLDIMLSELEYNEQTDKKEYLLSASQGEYLKSQTMLLKVVDYELNFGHGISFVIH